MDDTFRAVERAYRADPSAENGKALRAQRRRFGATVCSGDRVRLDGALIAKGKGDPEQDATGNWLVAIISDIQLDDPKVLLWPLRSDSVAMIGACLMLHESAVLSAAVARDLPLWGVCGTCHATGSAPCLSRKGHPMRTRHGDRESVAPFPIPLTDYVVIAPPRDPEPPARLDEVKVKESRNRKADVKIKRRDTIAIKASTRARSK